MKETVVKQDEQWKKNCSGTWKRCPGPGEQVVQVSYLEISEKKKNAFCVSACLPPASPLNFTSLFCPKISRTRTNRWVPIERQLIFPFFLSPESH